MQFRSLHFYKLSSLTKAMLVLLTTILVGVLHCSALPVGKTEQMHSPSDGVSSIVVILSILLAISVTINMMMAFILRFYNIRESAILPKISSLKYPQSAGTQFEKSEPLYVEDAIRPNNSDHMQLEKIIERGDMKSLESFFNLTNHQFSLHEAIRLACQFRQCGILRYLNLMVRSGDDIMKKMLEVEVKKENITETERCKIVQCLLLCVKDRGILDSKLVAWAIQHSSLDIVVILLFNKVSRHIDLNAYDDAPSPIMACFLRSNMCEARQILRNLWERTLYQSCNVKTQTLHNAILNWGENERPLHHGEGLPKNVQKSLLTYIAEIDNRKNSSDAKDPTGIVEVESAPTGVVEVGSASSTS